MSSAWRPVDESRLAGRSPRSPLPTMTVESWLRGAAFAVAVGIRGHRRGAVPGAGYVAREGHA